MSTVYNKVTLNGTTIMDISEDTVEASVLFQNYIAHGADGEEVIGSASSGGSSTDFIITLIYDTTILEWKPDRTFAEISAAHTAGKTLITYVNTPWQWDQQASGEWDSVNSYFNYYVAEYAFDGDYDTVNVYWKRYHYDSNGVHLDETIPCYSASDADAVTSDVVSGKIFYTSTGRAVGSASGGTPTIDSLTVTPSTSQQVFNSSSVDGYKPVTVSAMPSGSAGTPTATKGTVSNHSVSVTPSVTNTTGYITGSTKTGTAVTVAASELVSGTYTVDSSGTKDVTNYASASVPSGTAGTPSASKGAVSNHAVTVTPSVTNSTGWITGSTKTGTGVSVSASELVSGSETKTANGTYDVTNLASLVVALTFSTITVSSSNPTGGNNGDVWIKTS